MDGEGRRKNNGPVSVTRSWRSEKCVDTNCSSEGGGNDDALLYLLVCWLSMIETKAFEEYIASVACT